MATIKPSIPKGTRDFGPAEVARRQHIMRTIREVFELYGFKPIETPAIEQLSTLTGKYGNEGEKLLFKVLNSGDYLAKANEQALTARDSNALVSSISEKGLRYDLTIPFARYVVMHQNDITLPFRRYQMQPVWRADRPQKGRYREFWQCDADVVGSDSLVCEAELVQIYRLVFERLKVPVHIRINNRKVLDGIATAIGAGEKVNSLTIALDKLDKIGWPGVAAEMEQNGFTGEQVASLKGLLEIGRSPEQLAEALAPYPQGAKGIAEFQELFGLLTSHDKQSAQFDPTLARGLDYDTGTILEVRAEGADIGSIGGGGRYDDLTGVFGLPGVSGVGISFGLDRIYDVMDAKGLFPPDAGTVTQALLVHFDQATFARAFQLVQTLRKAGIPSELYPDQAKIQKQMKYAHTNAIPYVLVVGEQELASGMVTLKTMATGDQQYVKPEEAITIIKAG